MLRTQHHIGRHEDPVHELYSGVFMIRAHLYPYEVLSSYFTHKGVVDLFQSSNSCIEPFAPEPTQHDGLNTVLGC